MRGPEIIIGAYKWAEREPGFGDVRAGLSERVPTFELRGPPISLAVTAGRDLIHLPSPPVIGRRWKKIGKNKELA